MIQALKSGCVTIEKLLELSSFLLSHGSALEETHGGKQTFSIEDSKTAILSNRPFCSLFRCTPVKEIGPITGYLFLSAERERETERDRDRERERERERERGIY